METARAVTAALYDNHWPVTAAVSGPVTRRCWTVTRPNGPSRRGAKLALDRHADCHGRTGPSRVHQWTVAWRCWTITPRRQGGWTVTGEHWTVTRTLTAHWTVTRGAIGPSRGAAR